MKLPTPKHTLREYIALYKNEHTTLGNKLTHMVGIPMIVASIPTTFVNPLLGGSMFVGGWTLQFIGHAIEKNEPAFYSDPYYLLVGPAWVAAEWLELLRLPVPEALTPAPATRVEVHANGAVAAAAN